VSARTKITKVKAPFKTPRKVKNPEMMIIIGPSKTAIGKISQYL
jgi:hypothetical protein